MDQQTLINALIGAVFMLGGALLRAIWQSQRELQADNKKIAQELSSVKILVAGEYATRTDVDRKFDAMLEKLDRIESKLDRKVDK